jgi:hypothetical protein
MYVVLSDSYNHGSKECILYHANNNNILSFSLFLAQEYVHAAGA